jgi:acetolactate synthase I/II/III large subunit
MTRMNGGQIIVDYLIQERVPYLFGLCGHGNISLIDAFYERADEIKALSVHHETVAGFMADVYYRVSGRPVATFTSCGPGSANLPICLANSFFDSVPFLAVTGNVPTSQFNRGAFQETYRFHQADYPSTVRAYCKRVFQPTRADMVPLAIRQAWKTMVTARPGLVVLDVPFDIFKEEADVEMPRAADWNANITSRCGADPDGLRRAVDLLLAAERPVIVVGQGVKYGGAAADLLALAERLQIPVACSSSGLGAIDASHPLALGLISRSGTYQANHAARQADVLLALGVRFDDRTSSSWIPGYSFTIPPTKLIHVDIDPDEIARNYPVALGLMADVRTFVRQVLAELDQRRLSSELSPGRAAWLRTIEGYRQQWNAFIAPGFREDVTPIHPQRAAHEIDRALPDDAILVSDIGVHHNWLNLFCRPRRPDSLIGSMGFGPMGFGVAGVLGGQAGRARASLRLGVRRRRLLHARQRARHRRGVRAASGVGRLEQLCVRLDPQPAARLSGRPRARYRLPPSAHRRALQPGLRGDGPLGRRRGRPGGEGSRAGRGGEARDRGQQTLLDRREHRGRPESRRCRGVGVARPGASAAGVRRPAPVRVNGQANVRNGIPPGTLTGRQAIA